MADSAKHAVPVSVSDFKSLFSVHKTRRTVAFLYGFMLASLLVTVFFAFSPSTNSAAPWLNNVFAVGGDNGGSSSGYRSQVSSIFSYLFPNSTSPSSSSSSAPTGLGFVPGESNSSRSDNRTRSASDSDIRGLSSGRNNASSVHGVNQEQSVKNQTVQSTFQLNRTRSSSSSDKTKVSNSNQTRSSGNSEEGKVSEPNQKQNRNQTQNLSSSSESQASRSNLTAKLKPESPKSENKTANSPKSENKATNSPKSENKTANSPKSEKNSVSNETALFSEKKKGNGSVSVGQGMNGDDSLESLRKCDFFDGTWVRDDSYGLYYKPGSCSLVDEQFNCVDNGRPDLDYQKFKWKPKGCSIPRLDGKKLLEMLRGKRLVFVGDSLNRNMWESLVCILKNSVKDPSKVYEAHGRHSFRTEASYSFIFKDYGCTVEFFVTPFLVQEWDVKGKNGTKKETLRLDMMSKSAENYKTADVIVFNTGHWWTHDKTSKGEAYYQEGDKVYKQLNVLEAFRKAITTWGNWIDKNVNPKKSLVFFRGYSHSHFSGGQWNSGGACDSETVPISNETFLRPYLTKMTILEKVLTGMKTEVTYLNVTKMTDFRKDAHPSIYRRQNAPEEERRSPLKYQDCSHWCLPGVPDTWNEVLYAKLLVKFGQNRT